MSAMNFIDKAIEDAGSYAVYGKGLGDQMRKDVKYGPQPDPNFGPVYGRMVENPNSARIASLREELAKINDQIKAYDMEAEMSKYKFQYEADPSPYTSLMQNRRTAEQTEKIRKATENATKASNVQNAWKQLLIDEEAEKYNLYAIQNRIKQAMEAGNKTAYLEAKNDEARAIATLSRYDKEKKQYKDQFSKMLGIDAGETFEPKYDEANDANLAQLGALEQLGADIKDATSEVRVRGESLLPKEKQAYIDNAQKKLEEFRQRAETLKGILSPDKQSALNDAITAYEDSIPKFGKGQSVKLTKESFAKMTSPQLVKLGKKALLKYKNQGWTNPYLEQAIGAAK